jgi:biopolymer transport protein TolR
MASAIDTGGKGKKKSLDFEIVLTPFIDLFSVCISFSLLTAVWIQIGSMDVKQAVGGQAAESNSKPPPALMLQLETNGDVVVDVKDAPSTLKGKFKKQVVAALAGKVNQGAVKNLVTGLKSQAPSLNMALIQPSGGSVYEEIITMMDSLRGAGIADLGVSPL